MLAKVSGTGVRHEYKSYRNVSPWPPAIVYKLPGKDQYQKFRYGSNESEEGPGYFIRPQIQALTRDIGTNLIPTAGSIWKLNLLLEFNSDLFTLRTSSVFTNLSHIFSAPRLMCASQTP